MTHTIDLSMGGNSQDGKYSLSLSLFVSFHGDRDSKIAFRELGGNPFEK